MRKWKQALALVLALVMALSLVALPSFAADEDSTGTGTAVTGGSTNTPGLELRKIYDPSTGLLTLEAYATGSTTTTTSTAPVDIVLVLDVSGSMDDPINGYDSQDKIDALKDAVNGFIDKVAEKSPNSSIAIVKFGGKINNRIGNDKYWFSTGPISGEYINYTQTVKALTPASNTTELNAAVDALWAGGYTPAHLGLQLAKGIIENDPNTDRQKVVVLFTDGEPNGVESTNGFETSAANSAISNSKSIKDAGATVYTIGCFGTTPSDNSNTGKYMNRVSSNYPDATNMNNGTRGVGDFYKTVSSASELESIFTEIAHTAGGATLTLGSETVLKDVVSEYFDLPENASSMITAQSYSCTGFDADGHPTWSNTPDAASYAVKVDGKNVSVTGFDYSANWVGKDTTTGVMHTPGKKLVVTIPIVDNGTGMGEVPTNGTDSAVYDKDGKQVCPFAQPTTYFPYFKVWHMQSQVDPATGENTNKPVELYTEYRVPQDGTKFNITDKVSEGYLYGGTFSDPNPKVYIPWNFNDENPTAFTPQDQCDYYVWEVPNTYLRPRNYYVWRHLPENDGKETVVRLYPLAAVDRMVFDNGYDDPVAWYRQVGFTIDQVDYPSGCGELGAEINGTPTVYRTAVATKGGQHYETVYLRNGLINSTKSPIGEDGMVGNAHVDQECLAGIRLNDAEFAKFKSSIGVTFQPYWITLDGVKVYGTTARTCTYVDGQQMPAVTDTPSSISPRYVGTASGTAAHTMRLQPALLMSDADQQPPVVDQRLTVTVVDGSNTTQVKVAPNGSVRDQVAYQAPAGKIFAGWFTDRGCTVPADLDCITQDTTIYAKYVSDSYLDLHYVRNGLFRLRGVTLISAVDNPANYQESGIIVDGVKVPVAYANRYRLFYTASGLFGAARNARLMITQQRLFGSGTLEVTPYWVTKDGTTVLGQPHTLHYSARGIWE